MYGITKTRMLLTTVVCAAVAALFAAGANARIPADTSSDFAAQESLGIGRYAVLLSVTNASVTFSVEEICAALGLEQLRGILINEDAIKSATPGASRNAHDAGAAKSIAPVLASSEATQGVSESAVVSRSDVVSRYLDNNLGP